MRPSASDTDNGDFSLFGSYKVHFNYPSQGTNYGAVLFSTDALGTAYGFELLNTGAQRSQRVAEDRKATSAQQFVGFGSGEAEGVALVASRREGFVNLSFWTPDHGSVAVDGFAHYLRAALTPKFGEWDAGFGVQYFGGQASRSVASGGDVDTKGLGLDAQLQGRVGSMPLVCTSRTPRPILPPPTSSTRARATRRLGQSWANWAFYRTR